MPALAARSARRNALPMPLPSSPGIPRSAMRSVDQSQHLPQSNGWQPLDAYTRASPEEPGEAPWGENHAWHVAERQETWQSWSSWLGERKEDLRAPCQAACPVGTNAGLYVSLIAEGRYDEALAVAAEPNPSPRSVGGSARLPVKRSAGVANSTSPLRSVISSALPPITDRPGRGRSSPPRISTRRKWPSSARDRPG